MMDPIERGEDRAERAYNEATDGMPDGKYKCPGCEEVRDLDDMHPANSDPYGLVVCWSCMEEIYPGINEIAKTC